VTKWALLISFMFFGFIGFTHGREEMRNRVFREICDGYYLWVNYSFAVGTIPKNVMNLENAKIAELKLLLGTAAVESDLGTLKNVFQITDDGMEFINANATLSEKLFMLKYHGVDIRKLKSKYIGNLSIKAQVILCLIYYKGVSRRYHKDRIYEDIAEHAYIWKRFYNTSAGLGTVQAYKKKYYKFIKPKLNLKEAK